LIFDLQRAKLAHFFVGFVEVAVSIGLKCRKYRQDDGGHHKIFSQQNFGLAQGQTALAWQTHFRSSTGYIVLNYFVLCGIKL
jgi:hypothetical protein